MLIQKQENFHNYVKKYYLHLSQALFVPFIDLEYFMSSETKRSCSQDCSLPLASKNTPEVALSVYPCYHGTKISTPTKSITIQGY